MNERQTTSMLPRLPVILAVTAASYGLPLQPQTAGRRNVGKRVAQPVAAGSERPMRDRPLVRQR